jgi:hypothetical protein
VTLLFILLIGLPLTTISVTAALEGKGREGKGREVRNVLDLVDLTVEIKRLERQEVFWLLI